MKLASQQRSQRERSDRKLQECEEFLPEIPTWMNIARRGLSGKILTRWVEPRILATTSSERRSYS